MEGRECCKFLPHPSRSEMRWILFPQAYRLKFNAGLRVFVSGNDILPEGQRCPFTPAESRHYIMNLFLFHLFIAYYYYHLAETTSRYFSRRGNDEFHCYFHKYLTQKYYFHWCRHYAPIIIITIIITFYLTMCCQYSI
jgi:hypothetical protein